MKSNNILITLSESNKPACVTKKKIYYPTFIPRNKQLRKEETIEKLNEMNEIDINLPKLEDHFTIQREKYRLHLNEISRKSEEKKKMLDLLNSNICEVQIS